MKILILIGGGWVEAYQKYHPLKCRFLLLCNDSVFGPIGSIDKFWQNLMSVDADFYGAVGSNEIKPHAQSWFMMFRREVIESTIFRIRFLQPMPLLEKRDIINQYEIGLTNELISSEDYKTYVAFGPATIGDTSYPHNPALNYGFYSLEKGIVPFLKKELLRDNPTNNPLVPDWKRQVARIDKAWVPLIEDALKSSHSTKWYRNPIRLVRSVFDRIKRVT